MPHTHTLKNKHINTDIQIAGELKYLVQRIWPFQSIPTAVRYPTVLIKFKTDNITSIDLFGRVITRQAHTMAAIFVTIDLYHT